MNLTSRWLAAWMILGTANWQVVADDATPAVRPNIVFILADDLGWSDLACYGADLHESPHLDQLAREGVRFTQAYSMSVCSPTRAAIMTGKHAARLHFTVWRESSVNRAADAAKSQRRLLPPVTATDVEYREVTLAEKLQAAGYLTFHVGKWHLGDAAHAPETQGFDVNIGGTHWGAPRTYFWPFRGTGRFGADFRYVPGLGIGKSGEYLTDRFTDEAIRLIDQAGDRPFFLNLWFHSVHTPIEGKPEYVARHRARLRPGLHHQNPDYAAMVQSLDENVGRVLGHLQRRGLADRTIVVFTSDNGGYLGVDRSSGQSVPATNNAPLRSGKGSLYEGGIRVPLIVRWPGLTVAGSTCHVPTMPMDWYATLATVAESATGGKTTPAQEIAAPAEPHDGVDLRPVLREPNDLSAVTRPAIYFHYPHYYETTTPVSAVRAGDWKLLEYYEDGRRELYNLAMDPGEQRDLASTSRDKVLELQGQLDQWREAVGAQSPVANPAAQSR